MTQPRPVAMHTRERMSSRLTRCHFRRQATWTCRWVPVQTHGTTSSPSGAPSSSLSPSPPKQMRHWFGVSPVGDSGGASGSGSGSSSGCASSLLDDIARAAAAVVTGQDISVPTNMVLSELQEAWTWCMMEGPRTRCHGV